MGSLHKYTDGTVTYSPLGGTKALAGAPTSVLLLVALQACRLVWRGKPRDPSVMAAWRTIADVARGRRPMLSIDESCELCDALPGGPRTDNNRLDEISVMISALSCATDWPARGGRWSNEPLGDSLASRVDHLLGRAAYVLFCEDGEPKIMDRLWLLHRNEARALIHAWTKTLDVLPSERRFVVPGGVMRQTLLDAVLGARTAEQAKKYAQTLWAPSIPAPGSGPFPDWETSPQAKERAVAQERRNAEAAARAAAEVAAYEALSPEERHLVDQERASVRVYLGGLFNRTVH